MYRTIRLLLLLLLLYMYKSTLYNNSNCSKRGVPCVPCVPCMCPYSIYFRINYWNTRQCPDYRGVHNHSRVSWLEKYPLYTYTCNSCLFCVCVSSMTAIFSSCCLWSRYIYTWVRILFVLMIPPFQYISTHSQVSLTISIISNNSHSDLSLAIISNNSLSCLPVMLPPFLSLSVVHFQ